MPSACQTSFRRVLCLLGALTLALSVAASPALAADSTLTASPSSWDFGNDDVHSGGGPQQTFKFTNDTGADVNVSDVGLTGSDPGSFSLGSNTCPGAYLPPSASCAVDVTFNAQGPGAQSATLELNDDSGTLDVSLTGTGVTGTLGASPNPLEFNAQPWFYGGQQQSVNLQASNDGGVQITSATITGPDAANFSIAWGQNCAGQQLGPGGSCGMGIGFQPPNGAGDLHAALEVTSDSAGGALVVPLHAVALGGPHVRLDPADVGFGNVAVGQDAARTVTLANDGDSPLQIQQALVVTGTPQVFPLTEDGCSGQIVLPGSSCQFTVRFSPRAPGSKEASIFLISNLPSPVTPVGITGTGVLSPDGAATISGDPSAGGSLTCNPAGYPDGTSFAYQWLRNGRPVAEATARVLALSYRDVGAVFACRVLAVNSIGAQTVTSPQTAAVIPMDLSRQTGAFVGQGVCRTVRVAGRLWAGGRAVTIRRGEPATPWAPLTLTSASRLRVSIDGHRVGGGRTATLSPRTLADFADGPHTLQVSAGGAPAAVRLLLAPCGLAVRLTGGPRQTTSLWASSRTGLTSLTFTLPRGLDVRVARHRRLGWLSLQSAGYPATTFDLVGPRTVSNDVTVSVSRRRVRVTNLPVQVGVVRVVFAAGVMGGRGGTVGVSASVTGASAALRAGTPATWLG